MRIEQQLDEIVSVPVSAQASQAAVCAMRDLSENSTPGNPMRHRVPAADALIAGTAWHYSCAVLHYDGHFDRLATVLNFDSIWITDAGSL